MGVMLGLGDPSRHFWLARSVARVMGLDLGEALARGALPRAEYRAMIDRCRSCALVDACQNWLAASGGQAEAPPPGCRITAELIALKHRTSTKGAR
jgi:hypothetical protein